MFCHLAVLNYLCGEVRDPRYMQNKKDPRISLPAGVDILRPLKNKGIIRFLLHKTRKGVYSNVGPTVGVQKKVSTIPFEIWLGP